MADHASLLQDIEDAIADEVGVWVPEPYKESDLGRASRSVLGVLLAWMDGTGRSGPPPSANPSPGDDGPPTTVTP